jgi:hypothetical protein
MLVLLRLRYAKGALHCRISAETRGDGGKEMGEGDADWLLGEAIWGMQVCSSPEGESSEGISELPRSESSCEK